MHRPRVFFVPLMPDANVATRTFCTEPAEAFRAEWDTRVFPPSSSGAHRFVYGLPLPRRLVAALYWFGLVLPRRLIQMPRLLCADVVFVQRGMFRYDSRPHLERVVALVRTVFGRPRLLVHLDDAHYLKSPGAVSARLRAADLVVSGNRDIVQFAERVGVTARQIETGLPIGRYSRRSGRRGELVTIGWIGTSAAEHLEPIAEALAEVCDGKLARLLVVSGQPYVPSVDGIAAEFRAWVYRERYTVFTCFDIGIMPLADTAYNRAKEAFKLKEYMAAGLPTVASPVGHNRSVLVDGVTGFLASSREEWIERLRELVLSTELRARFGRAGLARAEEHYGEERFRGELAAAIGGLMVREECRDVLEAPR